MFWDLDPIIKMLQAGGWMMPPLVFVAGWIGYLLFLRTLELGQARRALRALSQLEGTSKEAAMMRWKMALRRAPVILQTLVTSAPLMGLLGTVAGMITTFDALGDGNWHHPTGGIAGGISQALLTTQLGLAISLPALLWQRLLQRRARRLTLALALLEQQGQRSDHEAR